MHVYFIDAVLVFFFEIFLSLSADENNNIDIGALSVSIILIITLFSTQDIRCDQLILFLEGQNCPLSPNVYFVRQREVTLSEVQLPFWIMSVSCNSTIIL